MNKQTLKTAVIGTGYLGNFHAQKLAALPQSELIAVCDADYARANEIAGKHRVTAVQDYRWLTDKIDAVSIAAPTPLHHEIALHFLQHGIHVLVEKPIATTIAQADELIDTAKKKNVVLQVGHLERFNNVIRGLDGVLHNPRFIESLRLAPFKLRGIDVNVVLDLMIHDIDIILSIVKSDITDIRASGASVLSPFVDIANARLEFANGCIANVTASRINLKMERSLRIFQHDSIIGLDLNKKTLRVHRKGQREMFPGIPGISREKRHFTKGDALNDQIASFLNAIIEGKPPIVSGEDGRRALATAIEITTLVSERNTRYPMETSER